MYLSLSFLFLKVYKKIIEQFFVNNFYLHFKVVKNAFYLFYYCSVNLKIFYRYHLYKKDDV